MPRHLSVTLFFVVVVIPHYMADQVRDDDVTGNPPWSPGGRRELGFCPRCPSHDVLHQLPRAYIIQLHVERFKRELLRKLGLSAPPNVTAMPLPNVHLLPRPLLSTSRRDDVTDGDGVFPDDDNNDDVDDDYAMALSDDATSYRQHHGDYNYRDEDDLKNDEGDFDEEFDPRDDGEFGSPEPPPRSKQIIIFGQHRANQCAQRVGTDCYQFRLSIGAHVRVTSAHLWLYKTRDVIGHHFSSGFVGGRNQTIAVRTADTPRSGGSRTLASVIVRRRSACWVRVDVHRTVLDHHDRGSRVLQLAVDCRGGCVLARGRPTSVGGDDRRPLLVVSTIETRRTRRRRTLDTTCPSTRCCLHRLYVDFARIGWSFISYPPGYEINYCYGPCHFRSWENDATRGYLGMLLYLGRQRSLRDVQPCCSATSTGSISLIYFDRDSSLVRQDVPNMQVLECGCA